MLFMWKPILFSSSFSIFTQKALDVVSFLNQVKCRLCQYVGIFTIPRPPVFWGFMASFFYTLLDLLFVAVLLHRKSNIVFSRFFVWLLSSAGIAM